MPSIEEQLDALPLVYSFNNHSGENRISEGASGFATAAVTVA